MKTKLYKFIFISLLLIPINLCFAKTYSRVISLKSDISSLVKKYGREIIEPQKQKEEKKDAKPLTKKELTLKKTYERNTIIGKEITLKNLLVKEVKNNLIQFQDDPEGQIALFYYTSEQKDQINNEVEKYQGGKFSVTGTFKKLTDFVEFDYISANVQH